MILGLFKDKLFKLGMVLVIVLVGCEYGGNIMHEQVTLATEDGVKLAGDYYKGGDAGIILLHMYTATKASWKDFANELQKKGYSVLAIDFRGHGLSDLSYKDFTEKNFRDMIKDAKAADEYLGKEKTIVIGASIGANIALQFANEVDGAIALSPSFNYKGIKTGEAAKEINNPVLIIVSEEDAQSYGDSQQLNNLITDSALETYSGKGHGTNMLDRETKDEILDWLDENIQ